MEGSEDEQKIVPLPGPKNPLDIYLVMKNVMGNLGVDDLVRCWSVNSLFRDVAQGFIAEKNPPMDLRYINQVVNLIHRLEQNELERDPDPLFPPNKYDIQIAKDNNRFMDLVKDVWWTRFGHTVTRVNIDFDPEGLFNWLGGPATTDEADILCLTDILENCVNLETLSIHMPCNPVLPSLAVGKLPANFPKLKRLCMKSFTKTEMRDDEVDLIGILLERCPNLTNLRLFVGHRFIVHEVARNMNTMLPEWFQRVRSGTKVDICMTVTSVDETVLRQLASFPPRVISLNLIVLNNVFVDWTRGACQALGQWLSSLRPTLQYLKMIGSGTGDLTSITSMEKLRELEITLRDTASGANYTFSPANYPLLERLTINSVDPGWIFQKGFGTLKELNLNYKVDDCPTIYLPVSWTLAFLNLESLKMNLWKESPTYRMTLLDQVAILLDGFQNVLHLEVHIDIRGEVEVAKVFKLLTGHQEMVFNPHGNITVQDYNPEGVLSKLTRLKTLQIIKPACLTIIRALLFSSVNGGIRRLERLTFIQWAFDENIGNFIDRLAQFHAKVECLPPRSIAHELDFYGFKSSA